MNGKIIVTLIAIITAIFAICTMDFNKPIVEGWWGGNPYVPITSYSATDPQTGKTSGLPVSFIPPANNASKGQFISTPSFQTMLSPRILNLNLGANVRYNPPSMNNMAAIPGDPASFGNCAPVTFGDMSSENYTQVAPNRQMGSKSQRPSQPAQQQYTAVEGYDGCNGCAGKQSCGKGGIGGVVANLEYPLPTGYANGNYNQVYDNLPGKESVNDLPMGTMSVQGSNGSLNEVVYSSRLMAVNSRSRLRAQGDNFRGDLAIKPCSNGWFSVYPIAARDLSPGYAMVALGPNLDSNKATIDLINASTGEARTTWGGVDTSQPEVRASLDAASGLGAQASLSASALGGDLNVTMDP